MNRSTTVFPPTPIRIPQGYNAPWRPSRGRAGARCSPSWHIRTTSLSVWGPWSAGSSTPARRSMSCASPMVRRPLHGVPGDLATIREKRTARTGRFAPGVTHTTLLSYPDMGLAPVGAEVLSKDVEALSVEADGLLVFDVTGITGHPDPRRRLPPRCWPRVGSTYRFSPGPSRRRWRAPCREETGAPFAGRRADQITHVVRVDRPAVHGQPRPCEPGPPDLGAVAPARAAR